MQIVNKIAIIALKSGMFGNWITLRTALAPVYQGNNQIQVRSQNVKTGNELRRAGYEAYLILFMWSLGYLPYSKSILDNDWT